MSRTHAPARWPAIAVLVVAVALLTAACGGSTTAVLSAAPSTAAATATAVPTPTAVPTATPTPVDVGAVFIKTLADPTFSATADITGKMTVGPVTGDISGDAVFAAGDSSMNMLIDADVFKQETATIQVDVQKWSKKAPGPWLEDPKPVNSGSGASIGKMLQSLLKVNDLGVVTKNGASLHHLQIAGTQDVSSALLGIDPKTLKDGKFSLDFYATDAGVPAIMSITGSWTQESAGGSLPVTMSFDMAFDDVGKPQTVKPPDDVWVVYTSKTFGYSMAHPADWKVAHEKDLDTYSLDGQGYVYVAVGPYKGSTAKLAADLKATYKKPFKGDPVSESPKQLGGVPAIRLIYEFTNDADQDVTIADDVVSRDGTGWEVYLATAGGQEDIAIFDQFVSTFTFTE